MDIKNLLTYNNSPPDFILEGFWYGEIIDNYTLGSKGNTILSSNYFSNQYPFDTYIEDINIPQMSLSYEKTDFDMINFSEKESFSTITLTFYDDVETRCLSFFQDWIDSIFDKKKNCLKNNWRYEKKDFNIVLVRAYRKKESFPIALLKGAVGGIANVGSSIYPRNSLDTSNIEIKTIAEYKIKGSLPKTINEISMSTSGGDRQPFSVELECEQVEALYKNKVIPKAF